MDFRELLLRFLLLFVGVGIMYFVSNRQSKDAINPLSMLIGFCTFSLSYLFTKMQIGIGIGFGLFAIFSILRFRTQTFGVNAVIFLFATITLSILDILCPFQEIAILVFFQVVIVLFYILAIRVLEKNNEQKAIEITLVLDEKFSLNETYLKERIAAKLKTNNFNFKLVSINEMSNEILVKVYY